MSEPNEEIDIPDLDRIVRFQLEDVMVLSRTTGQTQMVHALFVFVQNGKGRWVKALGGPIIAVGENQRPSRAELLEAASRMVARFDESHPRFRERS